MAISAHIVSLFIWLWSFCHHFYEATLLPSVNTNAPGSFCVFIPHVSMWQQVDYKSWTILLPCAAPPLPHPTPFMWPSECTHIKLSAHCQSVMCIRNTFILQYLAHVNTLTNTLLIPQATVSLHYTIIVTRAPHKFWKVSVTTVCAFNFTACTYQMARRNCSCQLDIPTPTTVSENKRSKEGI